MKVRWDAVVDRGPSRAQPQAARPVSERRDPVVLHVWPFGALSARLADRPVVLDLHDGFTLREAFAALARRCGAASLEGVLTQSGEKTRHCRVFVEGEPIDAMDTPVRCARSPACMEMILLIAAEGG